MKILEIKVQKKNFNLVFSTFTSKKDEFLFFLLVKVENTKLKFFFWTFISNIFIIFQKFCTSSNVIFISKNKKSAYSLTGKTYLMR